MNLLGTIKSSSKNLVNAVKVGADKYGPQIAVYSGLAAVLVGSVLACKQTLTIDELEKGYKKKLEHIDVTVRDEILPGYTEEKAKKDKMKVTTKAAIDICKHYAVPAGLMIAGSAAILGGTHKLSTRNAALTATVGSLTAYISDCTKRAQEVIGEEKTNEIFYGAKKTTVVDEDGNTTEVIQVDRDAIIKNPFGELWGPINRDGSYNGVFDQSWPQQNVFLWAKTERLLNERMQAKLTYDDVAVLYVDDVYKEFDINPNNAADKVIRRNSGWAWIKNEDGKIVSLTGGATHISLGVPRNEDGSVNVKRMEKYLDKEDLKHDKAFISPNRYIPESDQEEATPIWINPNCDGDITSALYDYYKKKDFKSKRKN